LEVAKKPKHRRKSEPGPASSIFAAVWRRKWILTGIAIVAAAGFVWATLPDASKQALVEHLSRLFKGGRTLVSYRLMADGQQLESGAVLYTGDRFHIEVGASRQCYLYVVHKNAARVSRVYPSEATGLRNPIQGSVRIPLDERGYFQLHPPVGLESFHFVASDQPIQMIEALLPVNYFDGDSEEGEALINAMSSRDILVVRDSTGAPIPSASGNILVERFVLEHRGTVGAD
jgi:hypothetical protein